MRNNIELILPLLYFDGTGSYHVFITQRSKDGHNKANKLVAEWYVSSESQLRFLMSAIEYLCIIYNARCYIGVNQKADAHVCWKMLKNLTERLETKSYSPTTLLSSSHDSCNGNGHKRWIIDIDAEIDLPQLIEDVNKCRSGSTPNNVRATIPTKNGYHLITCPFDLTQLTLPVGVEIKKKASTLLYYYE